MHVACIEMDFPAVKSRAFLWSWVHVTKARKFIDVHKESDNRRRIETAFDRYDEILGELKLMKAGMSIARTHARASIAGKAI